MLLTSCLQIKLLVNQVNTAKAIGNAEMILKTKKTTAAKTKALTAGVVAAKQNSYDAGPELLTAVKGRFQKQCIEGSEAQSEHPGGP